MAKRFTDTELWDKEWFMRLTPKLKCLVKVIRDKADLCGVWSPNWIIVNHYVGEGVTEEELLSIDEGRQFRKLANNKIYCIGFIEFQYGDTLSDRSPVHRKIIGLLSQNGILDTYKDSTDKIPYQYPINTRQEEEEEKEEEKDKEKEEESKNFNFSEIVKIYNGKSYDSQSDKIKNKFSRSQYEGYIDFISKFEPYGTKISKMDFPLMNKYVDEFYGKFGTDEILSGIRKMISLGIKKEMDLCLRLIDCIGFAVKKEVSNGKTVVSTEQRLQSQKESIESAIAYQKSLEEND